MEVILILCICNSTWEPSDLRKQKWKCLLIPPCHNPKSWSNVGCTECAWTNVWWCHFEHVPTTFQFFKRKSEESNAQWVIRTVCFLVTRHNVKAFDQQKLSKLSIHFYKRLKWIIIFTSLFSSVTSTSCFPANMRILLIIVAVLVSTSHSYVRRRQLHSLGAGTGKVLLEFQQNFTLWEHGAMLRTHNISDMMAFRVQNFSESYNKLRNTLVIKPIMTTFLKALFDDASAFRRTLEKYTRTSQIVKTTKQKFIPLIRNDIKEMQSRIIKSALALRCLEANKQRIGNVFTQFWRRTDPYIGKAFAELDARIRNYDHIIEESVKRREQTVIRGCHLPHATIEWNNSQKICYENYVRFEVSIMSQTE